MQAIIMAAGRGNRISEISDGIPKSFLKINGEKLIERQIRLLRSIGIQEIIIVVGYQKHLFEKEFSADDIRFVFNPFFETTNVLPSFWFGQKYLKDDFIYLHADTIFHEKIFDSLVKANGEAVLAVDRRQCYEEEMKVRLEKEYVIEINKTMPPAKADGEFLGIAKISCNILPSLKKAVEESLVNKEFNTFFEHALQQLIDRKQLFASICETEGLPWNEIDFPEDYERTKKAFA